MSRFNHIAIVVFLFTVLAGCGAQSAGDVTSTSVKPTSTTEAEVAVTTTTSTTPSTSSTHGQDHEDGEADGHFDRTIEIIMTDLAFEPAMIEVSAGETIKFVAVNEGAIEHELRLSNAHRIEEHLASGHEDHEGEGGHHEEGGDQLVLVAAGETGELTITFPEDQTLYTEIACLIPGHYEAGMKGTVAYR